MDKYLACLCLFLAIIPFSLAETEIYSGSVITGTDVAAGGQSFKFAYDEDSNKVFAHTPAGGLIIDNGNCKSNSIFRVCINEANFSYRNLTTYESFYEVKLDIYKLTGSLTASAQVSKSQLLQKESAVFTITISNPTDFDVTRIGYSQGLSHFLVGNVKGCLFEQGTLSWNGTLKPDHYITCTADITADKDGTFSLVGNLAYFNSYDTEAVTTPAVDVKVLPKQLKLEYSIPDEVEVNEEFKANILIQNINSEERLDSVMAIQIPQNIVLLKNVPGITSYGNMLKRTSYMVPDKLENYTLSLRALSAGSNPVKLDFDYTISGIKDAISNESIIHVSEPVLQVNFSSVPKNITPGQPYVVYAKIKNTGRLNDITDILARLNAPYNNPVIEKLGVLKPGESYAIISNTLLLPAGDTLYSGSGISVNLSMQYNAAGPMRNLSNVYVLNLTQKQAPEANPVTETENESANYNASALNESNDVMAGLPEPGNGSAQTELVLSEGAGEITEADLVFSDTTLKEKLILGFSIAVVFLFIIPGVYWIRKKRHEIKLETGSQISQSGTDKPKNI